MIKSCTSSIGLLPEDEMLNGSDLAFNEYPPLWVYDVYHSREAQMDNHLPNGTLPERALTLCNVL